MGIIPSNGESSMRTKRETKVTDRPVIKQNGDILLNGQLVAHREKCANTGRIVMFTALVPWVKPMDYFGHTGNPDDWIRMRVKECNVERLFREWAKENEPFTILDATNFGFSCIHGMFNELEKVEEFKIWENKPDTFKLN